MPNMPGSVTKTATFDAMDAIWSGNPEARMAEYDQASSITALLDAAEANKWITKEIRTHVEQHWLDKYWPKAEAQEVLQRGLYWAMRVAAFHDGNLSRRRYNAQGLPDPLPICCAWICSGGKPKGEKPRFEVISLESDHQVTVLFLTPPPKGLWGDEPEGSLQRVWSTRREEFGVDNGETKLEHWKKTYTVRPHDYEDYRPPKTTG
jgi:hypothetical protein